MRGYRVRLYLVADLDLDDANVEANATAEELGQHVASEVQSNLESVFDLLAVHLTVLAEPLPPSEQE